MNNVAIYHAVKLTTVCSRSEHFLYFDSYINSSEIYDLKLSSRRNCQQETFTVFYFYKHLFLFNYNLCTLALGIDTRTKTDIKS